MYPGSEECKLYAKDLYTLVPFVDDDNASEQVNDTNYALKGEENIIKNIIITLSTIITVHIVFVKIFKLSFPEIWFVE